MENKKKPINIETPSGVVTLNSDDERYEHFKEMYSHKKCKNQCVYDDVVGTMGLECVKCGSKSTYEEVNKQKEENKIQGIFDELDIEGDTFPLEPDGDFWKRKLLEVYDKLRNGESQ